MRAKDSNPRVAFLLSTYSKLLSSRFGSTLTDSIVSANNNDIKIQVILYIVNEKLEMLS